MRFNDSDHTYFNEEGIQYTSATQFVKKFVKPFEKEKKAKAYAKKHKKNWEEVVAEWEKLGSDSMTKGTAYHKLKEQELLDLGKVLIEDEEHEIFSTEWEGDVKISESLKLEPGVYPELIVWSDRYKIAGQVDYVEVTKSGVLNIIDYKTSKEIKTRGFENWNKTRQMLFFPLNNLEDCNFNHYALQINLYAFCIRQHNRNLELGEMKIQHVVCDYNEETKEVTVKEIVNYIVPNLQDEIKMALEYFKEKQEFTV
jgi:hypothetical protein